MTCNKTDFRMYSPLIGPAEEICWTCGVAKDKHALAKEPEERIMGLKEFLNLSNTPFSYSVTSGATSFTSPSSTSFIYPLPLFNTFIPPTNKFHPASMSSSLSFCLSNTPSQLVSGNLSQLVFTIPSNSSNPSLTFPPYVWITPVAPIDNFYGVNRSIDQDKLAGIILDARGLVMEIAILNLISLIAGESYPVDKVFMHKDDYYQLLAGSSPTISSTPLGVTISVAYGRVSISIAHGVPKGYAYACNMDSWREASGFGCYCVTPAANGRVQFT